MGIGRPRLALSRLRVKTPKHTISPLSVDNAGSQRDGRNQICISLVPSPLHAANVGRDKPQRHFAHSQLGIG
jgi:hypothetical protein